MLSQIISSNPNAPVMVIFKSIYSNKMHKLLYLLILLFISPDGFAQGINVKGIPYKIKADSLYKVRLYSEAGKAYQLENENRIMIPYKMLATINTAASYSKAGLADSAYKYYHKAIESYGFNDISVFKQDSAFLKISPTKYSKVLKLLQQKDKPSNPSKAKIITSDIDLFWKVYDKFKADSSNAADLFVSEYFEKGSFALQDYYRLKVRNIGGIKGFIKHMMRMRNFYSDIRENTLKVKDNIDDFREVFSKLKKLYPSSSFPVTTFLIGGWSAGGTATDYGLIIGTDMLAQNPNTDLSELDAWQKANGKQYTFLKHIVAHELVHIQQNSMPSDTMLLSSTIKEGMADFIGELISGNQINERLIIWAKGHEKEIWNDFKKEMYLNKYFNWIGNSSQERPDHPSDLGYWVGYQICKAYYEQALNKKQAIYDMLHIQDYKKFLEDSRVEAKFQ